MYPKVAIAGAALGALIMSSTASVALTGADCLYMNDYIRAVGTIENGDQTCGMSTAEAERILAAHDRETGAVAPPAPTKHAPRKHRRKKTHPQ